MQALSLVLVFGLLAIASLNGLAIRNKATSATDTTPCSTNASAAWLDIILIIDNSASMGAANLKKISSALSLSLAKFTIGTNYDITSGMTNSRVAVLTYNYQASIVAQFNDISNINDLASTLNKITVSNSPYADLYDPLLQILEWSNTDDAGPGAGGRPVVLLYFSASANAPVNSQVPDLIAENFDPYSTNVVTVNFNPSDANLTSLLNLITLNEFVLAPMYNLSGVSNTLSKDLEWALLQSNCFCEDGTGIPLILYDNANSRYTRYATCMILDEAEGFLESINGICSGDGFIMPAYILTAGKEKFVEGVWNDCEGVPCYPFYLGLHKNAQSNWVWTNWDTSDFPNNGYFDWGSGYPVNDGISNCTVVDAPDGLNYIWRNTACNTQYSLVLNILCQSYSCDAENTACVNNDYYNDDDQHSKMYKNPVKVQGNKAGSKKRQQMKYVKKSGKKNLKKNVHKKIANKV